MIKKLKNLLLSMVICALSMVSAMQPEESEYDRLTDIFSSILDNNESVHGYSEDCLYKTLCWVRAHIPGITRGQMLQKCLERLGCSHLTFLEILDNFDDIVMPFYNQKIDELSEQHKAAGTAELLIAFTLLRKLTISGA